MEKFSLSIIHPDGTWYRRESTKTKLVNKLEYWIKQLDPKTMTFKTDLEEVEAWRKFYLMKMMIFRAHGLAIFPSRYEGPMPE